MWENSKEQRNEGGFTLIELLIVIIILAILAAIVVFAVGTTTGNSKAAACNSDAKTVEVAIEAYKAQNATYPIGTPTAFPITAGAFAPALTAAQIATLESQLTTANSVGGPWLRQWPVAAVATNGYAITLDATNPGQVDVDTGTGPTNFDTTGQALCNAL